VSIDFSSIWLRESIPKVGSRIVRCLRRGIKSRKICNVNIWREAVCPECRSTAIRRSQRRGLIERVVLPMFGILPYRCQACDTRFYAKIESDDDA